MGTKWRRAFCTSIPKDPQNSPEKQQNLRRTRHNITPSSSPSNQIKSPTNCAKFGLFSSGESSNSSSSLRLHFLPPESSPEKPLLSPENISATALRLKDGTFTRSNPVSPRSPSRFALLKATLCFSRSRCGICSQSVKTGQKTAIFTSECSHSFHFPCISSHVENQSKNNGGFLSCPICSVLWHKVPLLSSSQPQRSQLSPTPIKDLSPKAKNNNNKMYNDDEPLLSPSASQGFNPIPEDETETEIINGRGTVELNNSGVEVIVLKEPTFISSDRNNHNYAILLKVKAPTFAHRSVSNVTASVLNPSCRAPIDLITVLDLSLSMKSTAKLQTLKRAMRLLISSLGSSDRLSIVAFSTGAKRLFPLVRMSRQGQRSARQIVDRIIVCGNGDSGDCRCIGLALRKATKVLEDRRERNPVATIMLLSDSEQKQGKQSFFQQEKDDFEKNIRNLIPLSAETVATRFTHVEIPIESCSELSGCNQVEDVFSNCVSGLVCLLLQDVHLQLNFPSGFISSVYSYGGENAISVGLSQVKNGAVSVRLGDFYADEKRELLVEIKVPASTPQHQRFDLLLYKCCYRDPTNRELVFCQEKSVFLRQISPAALKSIDLRSIFIITRALVESRRFVDQNDLETALHLLCSARSVLVQSNSVFSENQKYVSSLDLRISELQRRMRRQKLSMTSSMAGGSEMLTPTSAWRAAEQLAKVAILRKSMSRVGDLHGFENARF